ncbi:unnamed protein product, partial [Effrenium voratum]
RWKLHYASRIRFLVQEGEETRCLQFHEENVPLMPEVVKLEASVGSVLLPLAGVLREFGHFPPWEVERRLQEEVAQMMRE